MRTLSATVVLKEGSCVIYALPNVCCFTIAPDLRVRREAAEKAQLDLLSLYVA